MASMETPLSFNVSHTSKKIERCRFGPSKGVLQNWDCCTMEMSASLSSKLLPLTLRCAMVEVIPWTSRVRKSWSVLLWSPPLLTMFVGFLITSRLCSSIFCFFLLKRKVLSISGLGSYRNGLRVNWKIPASTITNTTSAKNFHKEEQ